MTPIKAGEYECVGLNLNRRGGRLDVYVGVPKMGTPELSMKAGVSKRDI